MKMGDTMLNLYVLDAVSSKKVPAEIDPASKEDFAATHDWQTNWESTYARQLPNKVALHREDNYELLGLMSYELDERGLAVEVLYMESARHSNARRSKCCVSATIRMWYAAISGSVRYSPFPN